MFKRFCKSCSAVIGKIGSMLHSPAVCNTFDSITRVITVLVMCVAVVADVIYVLGTGRLYYIIKGMAYGAIGAVIFYGGIYLAGLIVRIIFGKHSDED